MSSICSSANDGIEWHPGSVVLKSQKVLVGKISVTYDVVLLKRDSTVVVMPAYTVQTIRYYDARHNINRKFIALPDEAVKSHQLFEVVVTGEVYVLRQPRYGTFNFSDTKATDFSYFIKTPDRMVPIRNFKKIILPELVKNSEQTVLAFIKVNKLSSYQPASAIKIIQYYNKIQCSDISLALN